MKTRTLPLTRVGRSQAVCLPASVIRRHRLTAGLVLVDRGHEVVLRSPEPPAKLTWTETYREMAAAKEDWSEWEATNPDGDEASNWSHLPPPSLSKSRRTRK